VVVLHMRSERNQFLLENPSSGLAQEETVNDDIRAIMREPGMLVDVGYDSLFTSYGQRTSYVHNRYALIS
jgi:hypothetical protein